MPRISLVGAGPGDPELLTLKALRALQSADAVVYDRLVSDGVLALIPEGVPRIFAGKACNRKTMPQEEINALLIRLAGDHAHVVRLKGGDPLLFGRGGEEALACAQAGIAFEIIPGITSAQACAAYAGIPLTHRGLATGVRFITGHQSPPPAGGRVASNASRVGASPALPPLDWPSLADPDTTLVIYMGLANLATIAENLIRHGLPADFPAAAISHGTTPRQRVIRTSLSALPGDVAAAGLEAPVLIIIGRVAALAGDLAWFTPQPLENSDDYPPIFTQLSH